VRSALTLALVLCGSAAAAQSMEGTGRVTVLGGWRYSPNDHFLRSARAAGFEPTASPGGPQLTGTFAYAATSALEVAVDLFAGTERLRLQGAEAVSSTTYGALVGFRAFSPLGTRGTVIPNGGLALGPGLAYTAGGPEGGSSERLITVYAGMVGLSWRLSDTFALSADVRLLLGRGFVPGISGLNAGGLWGGLGATWIFPGEPERRSAVR
jgi:hypothetical protein